MPESTNGGQDLLSKLAGRGEEALGKLADLPGGTKFAELFNSMRERSDELQKRLRGIDELEKRVSVLEKRVAELDGKPPKPAAKRATPKRTVKKPPASGSATGAKPKPKPETPPPAA